MMYLLGAFPMGEEFDIRRYEPPDAERVWTVHELALESHGWEFLEEAPSDEDISENFLGIGPNYLDAGGEFLVGCRDNTIIAIGGFQPKDDSTVEIRRMAVHPAHQRQGYGERLLVELEDRAEKREFTRLVLETFERLTAARALYEKHGYEETHREPHAETGDARIYYRKQL
jgi:ribosomal protein S18 acetylase RimI-like enzyme